MVKVAEKMLRNGMRVFVAECERNGGVTFEVKRVSGVDTRNVIRTRDKDAALFAFDAIR